MSFSDFSKKVSKNFSPRRIVKSILQFPTWQNALLAFASAAMLILAFPDFEIWWLAWFALVPLLIAVERNKNSTAKSFWLGVLTGTTFFYGSCWWLTFAPIHYGGLPAPIVYFLLFPATLGAGFFVGIFAAIVARLLNKFGIRMILLAPFVWAACEFLRLEITGNAWNALGYSQAFQPDTIRLAQFGGVFLIGFLIVSVNSALVLAASKRRVAAFVPLILIVAALFAFVALTEQARIDKRAEPKAVVVALQPNVPMSNLQLEDYHYLRDKHIKMAEKALQEIDRNEVFKDVPRVVVFPESPMNYGWAQDSEFREFAQDFVRRDHVSLVFNAGEPVNDGGGYHNSAIMINERGEKIVQYDKIRLVPFGEFVPEWLPFNNYLPTVVGRTKPGKDFRLMPFGSSVRVGTMICYESAFGDLARGFVDNGADVLIEMTNDGYGGNTPIIRQHLQNAVFRAVETNRPVVRVTNIGTTAFISERGDISEATNNFETATRVFTISKATRDETFYVKYGDLFAWLCVGLTLVLFIATFIRRL